MINLYSHAVAFLAAQSGPGSILHLGTGGADAIAAYQPSDAERILLVEPQQQVARDLAAVAAGDPRVVVKEAAVAERSGRGVLQVFNFADLSSLRTPRRVRGLFPSLRVESAPEVATVTLGSLIDALPPADSARPDLLVVSASGEEATVVDALLGHSDRHRFGAILLRGWAAADDFEGSEPVAGLVDRLCAEGYRLHLVDFSDPDRPTMLVVLDHNDAHAAASPLVVQLAALRAQHASLQAENAGLLLQIEGQQAEIEGQHAQLLRLEETGEQKTAALLASHRAEIDALALTCDGLAAERDAAKAEIAALERRARDVEFRLGLAREEFYRSEGQISLIKDLLLHEGGL